MEWHKNPRRKISLLLKRHKLHPDLREDLLSQRIFFHLQTTAKPGFHCIIQCPVRRREAVLRVDPVLKG